MRRSFLWICQYGMEIGRKAVYSALVLENVRGCEKRYHTSRELPIQGVLRYEKMHNNKSLNARIEDWHITTGENVRWTSTSSSSWLRAGFADEDCLDRDWCAFQWLISVSFRHVERANAGVAG